MKNKTEALKELKEEKGRKNETRNVWQASSRCRNKRN